MVILTLSDNKLVLKVGRRIKLVGNIEIFVALAVTAFYLAIIPGSMKADVFMFNRAKVPLNKETGRIVRQ